MAALVVGKILIVSTSFLTLETVCKTRVGDEPDVDRHENNPSCGTQSEAVASWHDGFVDSCWGRWGDRAPVKAKFSDRGLVAATANGKLGF